MRRKSRREEVSLGYGGLDLSENSSEMVLFIWRRMEDKLPKACFAWVDQLFVSRRCWPRTIKK
jgi:hypothetical protein